ncbi:MAG: hypothetical protein B7Y39_10190 [Bdellovibrio sp. 28-41-41]|nr:MAG: hypothetical protein B7Y39_10190 [Bdellovibrio sp. 28-41-41]
MFFFKGTAETNITYNSFSVEYLLIAQEKCRLSVTSLPSVFIKKPLLTFLFLPVLFLRFIFLFIRLVITNQIIKSYLNSAELKELLLKKYENSNT